MGPFSLEEIIKNHVRIASEIASKLPVRKLFKEYLKYGYYPFFVEGISDYENKLLNALEKIFYEDIPAVWKICSDPLTDCTGYSAGRREGK